MCAADVFSDDPERPTPRIIIEALEIAALTPPKREQSQFVEGVCVLA